MNMALDNSDTCIGNKLAFYRYIMYSIDIYRTINFSIKQLSRGREEGGKGEGGEREREREGRGRGRG